MQVIGKEREQSVREQSVREKGAREKGARETSVRDLRFSSHIAISASPANLRTSPPWSVTIWICSLKYTFKMRDNCSMPTEPLAPSCALKGVNPEMSINKMAHLMELELETG